MEDQEKFIFSRMDNTEKHIGNLCTNLGEYTQKLAKLRNSGDALAQSLNDFGNEEKLNKTLRESLVGLSTTLASIEDYRNIQIDLLDNLILPQLISYRSICKNTKDQLRTAIEEKKKDVNQEKNIERTKNKQLTNKRHALQSDARNARLKRLQRDIAKNSFKIEEEIDTFESKKLGDLKKILVDTMQGELAFHVKAVELYTKGYRQAMSIECDQDLESLRNVLKCSSRDEVEMDEDEEMEKKSVPFSTSSLLQSMEAKKNEKLKTGDSLKIQDYEEIDIESSSEEF